MHGGGRAALLAALGALVIALQGCQYAEPEYQTRRQGDTAPSPVDAPRESVLGPGGLAILGGPEASEPDEGGGVAVNSYLWRASLDTISFMPLTSADPFGGVIITDWYSPPETRAERFKVTVYILGRDLRADGIRAAVFRQRRDNNGDWVDAAVKDKTALDLENAILTRARQLRIAGLR